jgi:hypothetical protein
VEWVKEEYAKRILERKKRSLLTLRRERQGGKEE